MLRLVTFSCNQDPTPRVGVAISDSTNSDDNEVTAVVDLINYLRPYDDDIPEALWDMLKVIDEGDERIKWIREILEHVETYNKRERKGVIIPIQDVKLAAPIPLPRRNILCIGKNYRDHIKEVATADQSSGIGSTSAAISLEDRPQFAQFFTKFPTTVIGPGCGIESHSNLTNWLDYEAELAIIIGKQGRDIPYDEAMSYIYGYTIANDITARDVQRQHGQWFRGKSLDSSCPLGPYLVHHSSKDFDPFNLSLKLWVNGEKRQDSNTSNMLYEFPEIIRQVSQGMTLYPGDIILTGTPEGVGYGMKPPQVLKPGDHIVIEIEHLGKLENTVVA